MSELRRDLTLTHGIAIVVGITIGTGVFLKSAPMAQAVGSPLLVMAAWAVAGLVAVLGALCFAELGTLIPRAGGEYQYVRAAFGDLPGFVYVCMSILIGAASVASYSAAFSIFLSGAVALPGPWVERQYTLFGEALNWQFGPRQVLGIAVVALFTGVNLAGVAFGGRVQTFLTSLKVLAVAGVIIGVFLFSPHAQEAAASLAPGGEAASALTASGFGFAMLSAMWAYSGWQYLPMTAAEVRDPDRNVPRAVIGGGLLIVVLYLLVNAAYFKALPFEAVLTAELDRVPGGAGSRCARGGDLPGAAGDLARGRHLPDLRGRCAERRDADARARALRGRARRALLQELREAQSRRERARELGDPARRARGAVRGVRHLRPAHEPRDADLRAVLGTLGPRAHGAAPEDGGGSPRPYRVPLYPLVPIAFVLIMAGILVSTVIESPAEAGATLVLLGLSLPLYPYFRRRLGAEKNS